MTTLDQHTNPQVENTKANQLNELVKTTICNAVENYEGTRSYGTLAIHIDKELQKAGITLPELQLKAIAIEALRRTSE